MDIERFAESPVGALIPIRGTDGRTGRAYQHMAFLPHPLGPVPPLSNATWGAVARAAFALGRLQQASRQVESPELLRRPTLRREAQSTSALEGTFAPLQDVLAAELLSPPSPSAELREVLNYVRTAEAAFGWIREERPMTVAMLCELQRMLVADTPADTPDAGTLRRIQVAIGSPSGGIEDARFVPPPPGPQLESGVHDLVDWINRPPPGADSIIAAGMTHYQFETLHPFNDGNGRIGRLLVVVQLLRSGLLTEPLLSVSPWFEARRSHYQERLAGVNADGDWDRWIGFFAEGLAGSAIDTAERVDALLALQKTYVQTLNAASATGVIRDIAESLVAYPFITIASAAQRTSRTYPAVNAAIGRLVDLGILRESTGRNYRRIFEAPEVLDVLLRSASSAANGRTALPDGSA